LPKNAGFDRAWIRYSLPPVVLNELLGDSADRNNKGATGIISVFDGEIAERE
jgi:hypothetical protein